MNRRTLGILGALALAGAACDGTGTGGDSLVGGRGGESGNPEAPGVFNTSTNNGPGGTPGTPAGAAAGNAGTGSGTTGAGGTASGADAGPNPSIDDRVVNYGEALRTASIKFIGVFPQLTDIQAIEAATTPAAAQTLYEPTSMRCSPTRASPRLRSSGGGTPSRPVSLPTRRSSRPSRRALPASTRPRRSRRSRRQRIAVHGHPHRGDRHVPDVLGDRRDVHRRELREQRADHRASSPTPGSCRSSTRTWRSAACASSRRSFVCSKFPAEFSDRSPSVMGSGAYTSPWHFAQHHRRRRREDQLPGHVGRRLRQLPHHDESHGAAVRELRRQRPVQRPSTIQVQMPSTRPVTIASLSDWLPAGRDLRLAQRLDGHRHPQPRQGDRGRPRRPAAARHPRLELRDVAGDSSTTARRSDPVSDSYLTAFQASRTTA